VSSGSPRLLTGPTSGADPAAECQHDRLQCPGQAGAPLSVPDRQARDLLGKVVFLQAASGQKNRRTLRQIMTS
jgi:hypothetical protein